jgi:hypothetical protein
MTVTPPATHIEIGDDLPRFSRVHAAKAGHHAHESHEGRHEPEGESSAKHARNKHRPYHPAPGIVVDVVDAQGAVAAADVQRVARNLGYWPIRGCYEDGLRADPQLAGRVALELAVGPGGAVDRADVKASTVHDPVVTACVAREARRLVLPSGDSPTTARVVVTLARGDEPVPTARPIPDADVLRQALRAPWEAVRRCYAHELPNHPDVGGRLELHFKAKRDGEVREVAEVGDSRFADEGVARCVVGVYRATKLPSLHASADRSFFYALRLEASR